ncbi:NAD-dependent epimerase/dehydratase family protein [Candidatus Woesearchaeota archaeon]|nr:NAD-dependent epimerase/dehydratase family protein [Candidatus Woesearchaeota archaeon]
MKKVVVIGSNSFSGADFIDYLLETGKYYVIAMSRSKEKKEIYLPYKKQKLDNFEFHQIDLNKDLDKLFDILEKEKPDYIVNFASQSIVGYSWKHPEHWYKTNVLSLVKFIDRLKDSDYLKKYVHITTPEVYGNCTGWIKEDTLFNPSTPYAASRAAGDVFIQMVIKQYDFPAVFTRAANVYGPGQQLFKILTRAIIFMKKGKKIPLHGGGYAKRSFIHIRDVSRATLIIMEKAKPGESYHISTDELIAIRDLVKKVGEKLGIKFEDAVEDVKTRRGLDDAYILDSSKLKKEFGWKAKIDLDEGIDQTISWINDDWDVISKEPLDYIHKE